MPTITVNGCAYHVVERGAGEPVVFAHGLLLSSEMFAAQLEALAPAYRCIAFDWRGQGRSEVTEDGYGMDELTADAIALLAELDAAPCHFVGLSMGGFVGMRIAARRPELLRSLTLISTAAEGERILPALKYRALTVLARTVGLRPVVGAAMKALFGRTFLRDPARKAERERWRRHLLGSDVNGEVRALRGVLGRDPVDPRAVRVPTLVLAGAEDAAVPRRRLEGLAAAIPGARLVVVPGAGHSPSVEQPEAVDAALGSFLAEVSRLPTPAAP